MTKLMIKTGDLIAVCDGRKALLLQNEGDEVFANFKTREVYEHPTPSEQELDTDRPGRVQEMATGARSAIEATDHHIQEEDAFLTRFAWRLGELAAEKAAHGFVIVAPARALGVLRKSYPALLRPMIRKEIDRDLVHLPVYEIERHLTADSAH